MISHISWPSSLYGILPVFKGKIVDGVENYLTYAQGIVSDSGIKLFINKITNQEEIERIIYSSNPDRKEEWNLVQQYREQNGIFPTMSISEMVSTKISTEYFIFPFNVMKFIEVLFKIENYNPNLSEELKRRQIIDKFTLNYVGRKLDSGTKYIFSEVDSKIEHLLVLEMAKKVF